MFTKVDRAHNSEKILVVKNHISKTLIKCPAELTLKIIYKHKQSDQVSRTNLYSNTPETKKWRLHHPVSAHSIPSNHSNKSHAHFFERQIEWDFFWLFSKNQVNNKQAEIKYFPHTDMVVNSTSFLVITFTASSYRRHGLIQYLVTLWFPTDTIYLSLVSRNSWRNRLLPYSNIWHIFDNSELEKSKTQEPRPCQFSSCCVTEVVQQLQSAHFPAFCSFS